MTRLEQVTVTVADPDQTAVVRDADQGGGLSEESGVEIEVVQYACGAKKWRGRGNLLVAARVLG